MKKWTPQIGDIVRASDRHVTIDEGRITGFTRGSILGGDAWTVAGTDLQSGLDTTSGNFAATTPASGSAFPSFGYQFYKQEMELVRPVIFEPDPDLLQVDIDCSDCLLEPLLDDLVGIADRLAQNIQYALELLASRKERIARKEAALRNQIMRAEDGD